MSPSSRDTGGPGHPGRLLPGVLLGLSASIAWAFYNIGVDIGRSDGFTSADLAILRYGVAALLLVPVMLWRGSRLGGLSLPRLALITVAIGPPFAFLFNTGFGIAPLAHAVVISPGMTIIVANLLPVVLDGQKMSLNRKIGMAVLIAGLVAIAADNAPAKTADTSTLVGDLCFVGSGSLWGLFTYLISRWRLPAVEAIGAASATTTIVLLPAYLLFFEPAALPATKWLEQGFYQGVLGGSLAIILYAAAIGRLGSGLAGLFPAMIPPLAVLLAIPIAGQWPTALQLAGVAIAASGLVISLDIAGALVRRAARGRDRATGPS